MHRNQKYIFLVIRRQASVGRSEGQSPALLTLQVTAIIISLVASKARANGIEVDYFGMKSMRYNAVVLFFLLMGACQVQRAALKDYAAKQTFPNFMLTENIPGEGNIQKCTLRSKIKDRKILSIPDSDLIYRLLNKTHNEYEIELIIRAREIIGGSTKYRYSVNTNSQVKWAEVRLGGDWIPLKVSRVGDENYNYPVRLEWDHQFLSYNFPLFFGPSKPVKYISVCKKLSSGCFAFDFEFNSQVIKAKVELSSKVAFHYTKKLVLQSGDNEMVLTCNTNPSTK